MAQVKRKVVSNDRPNKKSKPTEAGSQYQASRPGKSIQISDEPDQRRHVASSVLLDEEKAFPRGGASVLTPLEHRQIKAQAERDVLFEQRQGEDTANHSADGELFEGRAKPSTLKKKRQQKKESSRSSISHRVERSVSRIHGLNFKNLVVGSTVLSCVTSITSRDVVVALPNNIVGYIPITAVSGKLNERIEQLLEVDGPDSTDIADDDHDDVDLSKLFYRGQWLKAKVMATAADSANAETNNKRHIELTVDPGQVNEGIATSDVVNNMMIQATVRSVEDHGLVMELGLFEPDVKGFVSKKELGTAYNFNEIQEGQVMMCLVTGKGSNGKVLKLSPDASLFSTSTGGKGATSVSEAPNVLSFQPGTGVDVLVTECNAIGVVGKIMGMVDVTADAIHSLRGKADDAAKKFKIGSKMTGRVIWSLPKDDGSRDLGISLSEHMLILPPPPSKLAENASAKQKKLSTELENHQTLSSKIEDAKVIHVLPERGLFMALPSGNRHEKDYGTAYVHISQISDERVDSLSSATGPYKVDSVHSARVLTYNPIDNIHYVTLKKSTLEQPFLRIEDLHVGEIVKGVVERLIIGTNGVTGVLVKLSDTINGLIPALHMADAQLLHPERKFRESLPVRTKVLSVDLEKRRVRLTAKKSLVNSNDAKAVWRDYATLSPGMEGQGIIANLLSNGAVVQFYGQVRAWLPVAEMSETYIKSPDEHFRMGQIVNVRIISVDAEAKEMKVSCKDETPFDAEQVREWENISEGELVTGTVVEKSLESVTLTLLNGQKGLIWLDHLSEGSGAKAEKTLKKITVGKEFTDLVVLEKLQRSHHLLLSRKKALVEDARDGRLIKSWSDFREGVKVRGFVRNITPDGIYVEFASRIVGFLPKSLLTPEMVDTPAFGLSKNEIIEAFTIRVDMEKERCTLSMREQTSPPKTSNVHAVHLVNPVDKTSVTMADYTLGKLTKARITSVKSTQLNVRLADHVQGRVDMSEFFDSWEEIHNKKMPLQNCEPDQVVDVRILGIHDSRARRFLPISHRQSSVPVFELSAKTSRLSGDDSGLTMETIKTGSSYLAFINNHGDNCIWVNVSPNVKGRIALMDLSDDVSLLLNPEKNYPIGAALQVVVVSVDPAANRLDLTAKTSSSTPLTLHTISPGMILAGRITKITERSIVVQLSEHLASPVSLTEQSDDYDQLGLEQYRKNDIVRVCILSVDLPNQKVFISTRPSKVLSSSLPVKDRQIVQHEQLKMGDVVRGFVKHIGDKGVLVQLGASIDSFVRISDLSDQFIKDWKSIYQIDQLVKGRVVSVDKDAKSIRLSLKASVVDENYVSPILITDLIPGVIITGKVRKVEDFGAFIDIDNTQPRLSGLCHRSEVAAKRIEDVRSLYSTGDIVKAKVLKVDVEARKISLGLKASYFTSDDDVEMESDEDDGGINSVEIDASSFSDEDDNDYQGGVDVGDLGNRKDRDIEALKLDDTDANAEPSKTKGLKTSGFDWNGLDFKSSSIEATSDSEGEATVSKKRKRTRPEIKEDLTGDLDKYGPRNVSDYERQLLGKPNDSQLWIQYMAFQLELSETTKARDIAERALRMIHIREVEEKSNVWTAWLNLEVEYGDEAQVKDVFRQACEVQDPLEMHEKLASIYVSSGRYNKADALFEQMISNKTFRASSEVWLNYATFIMVTMGDAKRGRELLSRALQSIPTNETRLLTAKFAALEFRSAKGDAERGRTILEGILAEWPKWSSGWDMWVDLERSQISHAETAEAKDDSREKVRALYERIISQQMKQRRAKFVFKRWLEFEESDGDDRKVARVKALAREYVESRQRRESD